MLFCLLFSLYVLEYGLISRQNCVRQSGCHPSTVVPLVTLTCFWNKEFRICDPQTSNARNLNYNATGHTPPYTPLLPYLRNGFRIKTPKLNSNFFINLDTLDIGRLVISALGILALIITYCKRSSVRYVTFNTDLSTLKKTGSFPPAENLHFFSMFFLLFMTFFTFDVLILWLIYTNCLPFSFNFRWSKRVGKFVSLLVSLFIQASAISPSTHILCICVTIIYCNIITKRVPPWVSLLLILLSNDIELNPGDNYHGNLLTFMNWNLNSLAKNDFERIQLIEAHNSIFNYDLISLCETSLNSSVEIPDPLLNEYTFISANHPDDRSHGGVGLFFKNSLPIKIRSDLSFDESIVVELNFGRKKIFFTVLYRSPSIKYTSVEFMNFLSNFRNLHTNVQAENPYASFYVGDFNGHSTFWWRDGDTNPEGEKIEELFSSLNLSQLISEPTNFTPGKRPSCIDLITTDQPNLVLNSGTRPSLDSKCHHQIVHCKISYKIPPPPPYERKIWHYDRANVEALKRSMNNYPWLQQLRLNADPNWQVKTFHEVFMNVISNFVPNEIRKITPRDPPWISKSLKTLLRKKNRLFEHYKKHGYRDEDKVRLEIFRTECQQAVQAAKATYLTNMGVKLTNPNTTSKNYWKIIHKVMNKSRAPKIPPILQNGMFILNCIDKAKLFNEYFSNQCMLNMNDSTLPDFQFITNKKIETVRVTDEDILLLIRNLDPTKASGPDGISGHMLILCDDSIIIPLKLIFQNILHTSVFPDMWKLANVTPIHKKSDKQLIKNYRPISLLPICAKLFEKIIFNSLYSYLHKNNLITKNQSGFRPGDSTTNQLLFLVNEIHEAFNDPRSLEVRAVFLDISKAFDKVWHQGLLFKLKQNGISDKLLKLFASYLDNRKQRVALNGFFSDYAVVESGVPQGSVLGPLLFLIYVNDMEKNITSKIKFFADDTMIFSVINDPTISALEMNNDLEIINQWAFQWKMVFNPDPTKQAKEILFSSKKKEIDHPELKFNNNPVMRVNDHKHLGLILQPNLSFDKHIFEKMAKAKGNIGIIKHLNKFLPFKTLNQLYKSLVRSHLDYCDVIYHQPPILHPPPVGMTLHTLMKKIEEIQYQAGLAVVGAWQGTSRVKLYENLGWESLSDRRMCRRLLQLHKIKNNKTPMYLQEKLPANRLRPVNLPFVFRDIRCRTDKYSYSFFPNAISTWNRIITNFETMPTFGVFKSHLISLVRPNLKSTFDLHDPVNLRYLFQLRLGLSQLRYHKKRHNFADTPSDICLCNEGIENISHFFLYCPFYITHRESLTSSVNDILTRNNLTIPQDPTELYLYGHPSLSISENKSILLATTSFIKSTNRFSL